jgi:hypothetical protein
LLQDCAAACCRTVLLLVTGLAGWLAVLRFDLEPLCRCVDVRCSCARMHAVWDCGLLLPLMLCTVFAVQQGVCCTHNPVTARIGIFWYPDRPDPDRPVPTPVCCVCVVIAMLAFYPVFQHTKVCCCSVQCALCSWVVVVCLLHCHRTFRHCVRKREGESCVVLCVCSVGCRPDATSGVDTCLCDLVQSHCVRTYVRMSGCVDGYVSFWCDTLCVRFDCVTYVYATCVDVWPFCVTHCVFDCVIFQ